MPVLFCCPRGHQWEDLFDEPTLTDGQIVCPICKLPVRVPPPAADGAGSRLAATRKVEIVEAPGDAEVETVPAKSLPEITRKVEIVGPPPEAETCAFPPIAPSRCLSGLSDCTVTADGPPAPGSSTPSVTPANWPTVPGYEILGELGRGGMGVVYKARQQGLNRLVALKMILAGGQASERERARFRSEAEAFGRLRHPNIAQVYEVGEYDGKSFLSLEYVDGGSLAAHLNGKPMPPMAAAELIETVARAMHYAHQQGIVHRDLKPANVLLQKEDEDRSAEKSTSSFFLHRTCFVPKVVDFGLAKLMDEDSANTETGLAVGTPNYMAPEQARGRKDLIGPGVDIYALGTVLYELLTGRVPFRGETPMAVLLQVTNDEPVPPSTVQRSVPRDLETVCLKCLQKEPRHRYASAGELAEDLRRFRANEPILARPVRPWERAARWVRRRPAVTALLGCLTLAVVGLAIGASLFFQAERRRTEAAREEVQDLATRTGEALKNGAWENVRELLASADAKVASCRTVKEVPEDAVELLEKARKRLAGHDLYLRFVERRDGALFQATLSGGDGSPHQARLTRDQARAALALVGVEVPATGNWTPPADCDSRERDEIRQGCFELLLVLAEALARAEGQASGEVPAASARQALAALDQAAALGRRSRGLHLKRARFLALAGDEEEARREREQAAKLPPAGAEDFFLLGDEEYKQGKVETAQAAFAEALRLQADHFWARYFLALCYVRQGKLESARDNLTTCLSGRPGVVWVYLMRGYVQGQLGNQAAAEDDFARALDLLATQPNPDAAYALYNNRGVLRVGAKKFAEAEADFRTAIALKPDSFQAYVSLAEAFHQQGKLDEAVRELDRALAAARGLVDAGNLGSDVLVLLYRSRARFNVKKKDLANAIADLEQAAAADPTAGAAAAKAHFERGQFLVRGRHLEEALQAFDATLRVQPNHAEAQRWRAEVLFQLKRYPETVRAFNAYFQNGGKPTAKMYLARGLAHARLGESKAALDDFTLALSLEPTDANLWVQRGQTYLACQAPDLALNDLNQALEHDPRNGPAFAVRGAAHAALGQTGMALADAEKAAQFGPPTTRLLYDAARLFAWGAGKPDGRGGSEVLRRLERAFDLLGQALAALPESQRTSFWRDKVCRDPVWIALRQAPAFATLDRRFAGPNLPSPAGPADSSGR